jgi:hypothetical protein
MNETKYCITEVQFCKVKKHNLQTRSGFLLAGVIDV